MLQGRFRLQEGLASKTLITRTQPLPIQGQCGNSKELQTHSSSICSSWQDFCLPLDT